MDYHNQQRQPSTTPAAGRGVNASGATVPVWYRDVTIPEHAPLTGNAEADVCVVGAGIAGLTTAYLLARAGKSVIVLDEKPIAGGESGRTSAHLASAIDDRFTRMERLHGEDAATLHSASHAAAIDLIERIALEESIDCGFTRLNGMLFLGEGQPVELINDEFAAARRAHVPGVARLNCASSPGLPERPCLQFPNQARFHPLKYLVGLAGALHRLGVHIYCGERVVDLAGNGPATARLRSGNTVTASWGVAATNVPSPINNWTGIYTKIAPYRTYVAAFELLPGAVTDALYWDMLDPYHYVRIEPGRPRDTLIVGGEDHKTGQPGGEPLDRSDRFDRLASWTRAWFPAAGEMVHRWSGQVSEPNDGMAFIGQVPTRQHDACYVITGDSGMGLTHGTLGAIIVSDLILGRDNPWAALYNPARKPLAAAGEFLRENLNAAAQLSDHFTTGELSSADQLPRGHGALIRDGLRKLAVYRDADGELHTRSATCPHLGCVVQWNPIERSWDCPCHGSRFDARGGLITGPAVDDLKEA
jgi:glycine/D-amino acid oxidase-like deaminating enzyme/nitrite reductase/ring-hydroxylating ferredoxin subunit